MTVTRDEILTAIESMNSVYEAWRASTDESLRASYNGRPTKMMSGEVEEAAAALFELCDTEDIEREAWPLVRAIDVFDDAMAKFVEDCQRTDSRRDPSGGNEVWRPWEDVLRAVSTPPRFRPPEPIQQLVANRVDYRQIAKMYYWYDEFREPDVQRVQREIDQPGSEYQADTWQHPRQLQYDQEMLAWWASRIESMKAAREQETIAQVRQQVAESLDELILSGVNLQQILKMKPGTSEESVRRRADELGIGLDAPMYLSQRQAQLADEERRRRALQLQREPVPPGEPEATVPAAPMRKLSTVLSHVETYPELAENFEARILRMAEDGRRPREIADQLTAAVGRAFSASQVGRVVKQHFGQHALRKER